MDSKYYKYVFSLERSMGSNITLFIQYPYTGVFFDEKNIDN